MIKKIIRKLNAVIYSFKYLKNPFVIFQIPFKKEIEIKLKNNEKILIKGRLFQIYIEFLKKWSYSDKLFEKNGMFENKKYKYKLRVIEPRILFEKFNMIYYAPKIEKNNILDIGGYCGETALFFIFEENAKKVFVYEPVKENIELIKENIEKNNCEKKVLLYTNGVSNKDGMLLIKSNYPPGSASFGEKKGEYSLEIPVESWDTILEKHKKDNIYLAKVDCEGGEKYLVDANKELIKTICNWVIETHSLEIEKNIIELFENLGYKKELRAGTKKDEIRVWSFSR